MAPEIERIIQQCLDIIERSLRAQITPKDLSEEAGFSLYHFYRLFEAATGMSIMRYITRRRLLHAAYDMSRGKDAITAALEYGFDTHAGFYKAFRREFGCGPKAYLRTHQAARPARVNLKEVTPMMDMKQIIRALEAWGHETIPVANVYYANTGNRSDHTFTVGSDYFLKGSASLGELHRQVQLHKALCAHGLAPEILPAQDGREVVRVDETDFILMRRMQGQSAKAMHMLLNPQDARPLGEGLARMHAALQKCSSLLCWRENYVSTLRTWAIPEARKAMAFDEAWLCAYEARIAETFPRLPAQIVHRDPNPDNILIQDGQVVGFMDFDLSRILPRIFDLCYTATSILCDTFTHTDQAQRLSFFDAAGAIWQGYHACSPLIEEEWAALPDMVIAIQLTCVAAFAGSDKLAELAKINQQMLQMMLDHTDRFITSP